MLSPTPPPSGDGRNFVSLNTTHQNGFVSSNNPSNDLTTFETQSKGAADRSVNSEIVAEWVVNPDPIVSAIYTATASQAAFPRDIVNLVTEYLQNYEALQHLSIFGPSDWSGTFNKKVEMIKPPLEMDAFLQRINPFTGKLNAESCLCVFIPSHYQNILPNQDITLIPNTKEEQEVANNPLILLTPATMQELAKNPLNPDNKSEFRYYLDYENQDFTSKELKEARNELLHLHVKKSYWVVITVDVILGSRNQSYSEQQELVNEKGAKEDWQVPSIREAIICAFAHYAKTGVRILNDDPWTYTRCIEQLNGYQTTVGGFNKKGLSVDRYNFHYVDMGVAVLRKFAF